MSSDPKAQVEALEIKPDNFEQCRQQLVEGQYLDIQLDVHPARHQPGHVDIEPDHLAVGKRLGSGVADSRPCFPIGANQAAGRGECHQREQQQGMVEQSFHIDLSLFRCYSEKCSLRLYHASATLSCPIQVLLFTSTNMQTATEAHGKVKSKK